MNSINRYPKRGHHLFIWEATRETKFGLDEYLIISKFFGHTSLAIPTNTKMAIWRNQLVTLKFESRPH